ncbi:Rieske (2Fe-2S) protein [Streptomyces sp. NA04227]|uniref:Rieske (2Fe-2S) protein n=1 Tax=Streptomyces sp. NA04227 TaxID=2742136 RepID=UPI00159273C2|nr:Rieske (2Fe-2S) protein [Streptomyces sp. NA04227]QKW05371.1 Rieske (2Fe-2S) protein [Streptomyces sp. NA04227]
MSLPRSQKPVPAPTRRAVVAAASAAGLAAALAACGDSGDSGSGEKSSSEGAGKTLAPTSDIPVGGGKIYGDDGVVVTQPKEGEFKAFTNICTHRQCPVASVSDGTINCTCHGSKFSIEDGTVKEPPATRPLGAKKIEVSGGQIKLV